nr:MAG TPA: hypothetical protein [Caudoviricetes sp.]
MSNIKLQGIHSPQKAIPAGDLKPGMVTVWNFGFTETIKKVEPTKSGEYTRTMRVDRLVAVKEVEEEEPKNPIDAAIKNRDKGPHIYAEIGSALESFDAQTLAQYYIEHLGEGVLRNFIKQGIIANEISKVRK